MPQSFDLNPGFEHLFVVRLEIVFSRQYFQDSHVNLFVVLSSKFSLNSRKNSDLELLGTLNYLKCSKYHMSANLDAYLAELLTYIKILNHQRKSLEEGIGNCSQGGLNHRQCLDSFIQCSYLPFYGGHSMKDPDNISFKVQVVCLVRTKLVVAVAP